jgi:hypothetical protein
MHVVTLPAHEIRAIAVISQSDPRSVVKRLRREPVRPLVAARIDAALAELGLTPPVAIHDRAPEASR